MTEPLTDQQLAAIRRDVHESLAGLSAWAADDARAKIERLEQVATARLRAELAKARADRDRLLVFANWTARNTRPLTEIHTAALAAIDSPSTRAALADLAEIAADMATTPACTCGAEAVHQTGCPAPARA